jgi:hypothetical protein
VGWRERERKIISLEDDDLRASAMKCTRSLLFPETGSCLLRQASLSWSFFNEISSFPSRLSKSPDLRVDDEAFTAEEEDIST